MVGASCTAELIQDDPGGLAATLGLPVPVMRSSCRPTSARKTGAPPRPSTGSCARWSSPPPERVPPRARPRCNLLGPRRWAFATATTCVEMRSLLDRLGIDVNVSRALRRHARRPGAPDRRRLQRRAVPRGRRPGRRLAERTHRMPRTTVVPIGRGATIEFIRQVAQLAQVDCEPLLASLDWHSRWYSRSVDSTYLTGKRVFVFGDATHAIAAARVAATRWASRSSAWAPTAASSRARCARPLQALRRRGADHRRLPRGRATASPSCSPSWCWARRWNATSPSAWACPAR
jgi:light-independent protochlorophyllide reductase subunit B